MFIPENTSNETSNYSIAAGNYTLNLTQKSKIEDSNYYYSGDEEE